MIKGAKPCPFCGSTKLLYDYTDSFIDFDFAATITCADCFATSPIEGNVNPQFYAAYLKIKNECDKEGRRIYEDMFRQDAKEKALELWNRRI